MVNINSNRNRKVKTNYTELQYIKRGKWNCIFRVIICCCIFLSSNISFNEALSLDTDIKVSDASEAEDASYSQQDLIDQDNLSTSKTTLHRKAFSNNTSELFAKVIDMEEQLRSLNGRLENTEHSNLKLTKQLYNIHKQIETLAAKSLKTNSKQIKNQKICPSITNLQRSISLIKTGKNTAAITLLNASLQRAATQKKQLDSEGEVYYWLAKAYMNKKSSDKAVYYFTKSYKYYSNVRLNSILVNLIEALESNKKYKQICPLLKKLSVKYVNTLSKNKQTKMKNLKNTHCKR